MVYSMNQVWLKCIAKAVKYANDRGWTVLFKPKAINMADGDTKTVTINSNQAPRRRFYLLLHELGHLVLFERSDYYEVYRKHYSNHYTLKYKIGVIEEEIDAWNAGENLALRHGWNLDPWFDVVRASRLNTYMLWCTDNPDYVEREKNSAKAVKVVMPAKPIESNATHPNTLATENQT